MNNTIESSHTITPGPWLAIIDRCRNQHGVISQAADGYGVAMIPQNEANARLIAAAPELLAAAKDGLACAIAWGGKCEAKGELTLAEEAARIADGIRITIAKATAQ